MEKRAAEAARTSRSVTERILFEALFNFEGPEKGLRQAEPARQAKLACTSRTEPDGNGKLCARAAVQGKACKKMG